MEKSFVFGRRTQSPLTCRVELVVMLGDSGAERTQLPKAAASMLAAKSSRTDWSAAWKS